MIDHRLFRILVLPCFYATSLIAQSSQNHGKGNAVIGQDSTPATVHASPTVEKELRIIARDTSSSANWQGTLVPGDSPTNWGNCTAEEKDWVGPNSYVINGGTTVAACSELPCDILHINGQDILSLIPMGKSGMGVQAAIFGDDGTVLASVEGSAFHVNKHSAFYFDRPDTHTLIVRDDKNRQSLWISFENKHFVHVKAQLADANGVYLDMQDTGLAIRSTPSVNVHGSCSLTRGAKPNYFPVFNIPSLALTWK